MLDFRDSYDISHWISIIFHHTIINFISSIIIWAQNYQRLAHNKTVCVFFAFFLCSSTQLVSQIRHNQFTLLLIICLFRFIFVFGSSLTWNIVRSVRSIFRLTFFSQVSNAFCYIFAAALSFANVFNPMFWCWVLNFVAMIQTLKRNFAIGRFTFSENKKLTECGVKWHISEQSFFCLNLMIFFSFNWYEAAVIRFEKMIV